MYSLIVAVISITLGVGIALSTVYYGGEAFTASSAKTRANTVLTAMQQIKAADQLFEVETGAPATSIDDLVTAGYLKSTPSFSGQREPVKIVSAITEVNQPPKRIAILDVSSDDGYLQGLLDEGELVCTEIEKLNGPGTLDASSYIGFRNQQSTNDNMVAYAQQVLFDCMEYASFGSPRGIFAIFYRL